MDVCVGCVFMMTLALLETGEAFRSLDDAFVTMGQPTSVWFHPGHKGTTAHLTYAVAANKSPDLRISWWAKGEPVEDWIRNTNNKWTVSFGTNNTNIHLTIPADNTIQNVMIYCKQGDVIVKVYDLRQKEKKLFGSDDISVCPLLRDHLTIITCRSTTRQDGGSWEWYIRSSTGRKTLVKSSNDPFLVFGRDTPAEEGLYYCRYRYEGHGKLLRHFAVLSKKTSDHFDSYFCGHVSHNDLYSTEGVTSTEETTATLKLKA